jgi:hypothetical protein
LVFNWAFDWHPAVIVRCTGASDVARSLDFAQSNDLQVAVRTGGHSRLGYGMCDGGVVIDLSTMRRVEVDAEKRVARAEAGALVRDLDEATQRFSLATTSGGCPTVGIAGLTLGGGEGRMMDKYGAARPQRNNAFAERLICFLPPELSIVRRRAGWPFRALLLRQNGPKKTGRSVWCSRSLTRQT